MADKKTPVILITGYLGSGKTTLMQDLLKQEQRKIALIVNDMGSVNIDAALLNKNRDRIASVEMVELQKTIKRQIFFQSSMLALQLYKKP